MRLAQTRLQEKVVILIDEYDVPLQKAEEEHYYREMVSVISKFFGSILSLGCDQLDEPDVS